MGSIKEEGEEMLSLCWSSQREVSAWGLRVCSQSFNFSGSWIKSASCKTVSPSRYPLRGPEVVSLFTSYSVPESQPSWINSDSEFVPLCGWFRMTYKCAFLPATLLVAWVCVHPLKAVRLCCFALGLQLVRLQGCDLSQPYFILFISLGILWTLGLSQFILYQWLRSDWWYNPSQAFCVLSSCLCFLLGLVQSQVLISLPQQRIESSPRSPGSFKWKIALESKIWGPAMHVFQISTKGKVGWREVWQPL